LPPSGKACASTQPADLQHVSNQTCAFSSSGKQPFPAGRQSRIPSWLAVKFQNIRAAHRRGRQWACQAPQMRPVSEHHRVQNQAAAAKVIDRMRLVPRAEIV